MNRMTLTSFLEALESGEVYLGRDCPTVEFLPSDDRSLPRVRFTWSEHVRVSEISHDELISLPKLLQQHCRSYTRSICPWETLDKKQPLDTDDRYYIIAHKAKREHMTLCNFRRYSWAYTDDPKGLTGYGGGVIYANGNDGGLNCSSSEQVVRETLVRTLCKMEHRGCPSKLLYGQKGRGLTNRLLKDALSNIRVHATFPMRSPNGPIDHDVLLIE